MKRFVSFATACVLALTLTACQPASKNAGNDKAIAKVNGKTVSFNNYKKNLAVFHYKLSSMYGPDFWNKEAEQGKTFNEMFKGQMLEDAIQREAVQQAAEKAGLSVKDEDIQKDFDAFKDQTSKLPEYDTYLKDNGVDDAFLKDQIKRERIASLYKEDYLKKNPISDEAVKKYYDDNQDKYKNEQVKASHILFKTVDEQNQPLPEDKQKEALAKAQDIEKKLKAGQKFEELAKQYSEDKGSAEKGGDLDFFTKEQMVPEFSQAAFSMEKGKVSEPVKSMYGYHVIKVTDKKTDVQSFDTQKESIKKELEEEAFNAHIEQLVKEAQVEKHEDLLKEADPKPIATSADPAQDKAPDQGEQEPASPADPATSNPQEEKPATEPVGK